MAPYPPSDGRRTRPTIRHEVRSPTRTPAQSPDQHPTHRATAISCRPGPYPYPAEYIRVVGGTTWHWAAHMWRNVPERLSGSSRSTASGEDWPITYDDLDPWYYEAEVKTGVSGAPNTGSPRTKPFPDGAGRRSLGHAPLPRAAGTGGYPVVSNTTARNSRAV